MKIYQNRNIYNYAVYLIVFLFTNPSVRMIYYLNVILGHAWRYRMLRHQSALAGEHELYMSENPVARYVMVLKRPSHLIAAFGPLSKMELDKNATSQYRDASGFLMIEVDDNIIARFIYYGPNQKHVVIIPKYRSKDHVYHETTSYIVCSRDRQAMAIGTFDYSFVVLVRDIKPEATTFRVVLNVTDFHPLESKKRYAKRLFRVALAACGFSADDIMAIDRYDVIDLKNNANMPMQLCITDQLTASLLLIPRADGIYVHQIYYDLYILPHTFWGFMYHLKSVFFNITQNALCVHDIFLMAYDIRKQHAPPIFSLPPNAYEVLKTQQAVSIEYFQMIAPQSAFILYKCKVGKLIIAANEKTEEFVTLVAKNMRWFLCCQDEVYVSTKDYDAKIDSKGGKIILTKYPPVTFQSTQVDVYMCDDFFYKLKGENIRILINPVSDKHLALYINVKGVTTRCVVDLPQWVYNLLLRDCSVIKTLYLSVKHENETVIYDNMMLHILHNNDMFLELRYEANTNTYEAITHTLPIKSETNHTKHIIAYRTEVHPINLICVLMSQSSITMVYVNMRRVLYNCKTHTKLPSIEDIKMHSSDPLSYTAILHTKTGFYLLRFIDDKLHSILFDPFGISGDPESCMYIQRNIIALPHKFLDNSVIWLDESIVKQGIWYYTEQSSKGRELLHITWGGTSKQQVIVKPAQPTMCKIPGQMPRYLVPSRHRGQVTLYTIVSFSQLPQLKNRVPMQYLTGVEPIPETWDVD